jgi:hypothetical protein
MIETAQITYSKTFSTGNLVGITVVDQHFHMPLNDYQDRLDAMQRHAEDGTVFADTIGSGKFTISDVRVII